MTEAIITKDEIIDTEVPVVKLSYHSGIEKSQRVKVTSGYTTCRVLRRLFNGELEHIETMWVLALNRANEILCACEISRGGISGTVCDPKIVFQFALKANASAIILSHNHPSGNLSPSEADKKITEKIKKAGNFLEIELLDHVIITPEAFYSFAEEGEL